MLVNIVIVLVLFPMLAALLGGGAWGWTLAIAAVVAVALIRR
jgi:hypothetical protein